MLISTGVAQSDHNNPHLGAEQWLPEKRQVVCLLSYCWPLVLRQPRRRRLSRHRLSTAWLAPMFRITMCQGCQWPSLIAAVSSFIQGYGLADVENSVPATADTVYRIASISKSITSTGAMKLVEAGKLDLDAPI